MEVKKDGTIIGRMGRSLKGNVTSSGYRAVECRNERVRKIQLIHRLVAEKYIPNPENKPCVNHKDGNKLNNHADNLEWVTHLENSQHAIKMGLRKPYEKTDKTIAAGKNVGLSRRKFQLHEVVMARYFRYELGWKITKLEKLMGASHGSFMAMINGYRNSYGLTPPKKSS